jgi:transcriptional regulator with XRE-family HTH domain
VASQPRANRKMEQEALGGWASAHHRATRIGPRLRSVRQERRLTIEEVATAAGLSKGFVSRLERADASVSLAALLRICDALGLPAAALFEDVHDGLLHESDAPALDYGGSCVESLLLTPPRTRQFQVWKIVLQPGGGAGEEQYTLPCEAKFVHVSEGELELEIEGDVQLMSAGDSITFSPRVPHTWRNPSTRARTVAFFVVSPAP